MNDKLSIIIAFAAITLAAFRLYQRYMKNKQGGGSDQSAKGTSPFSSKQKDDDYEPYSKK